METTGINKKPGLAYLFDKALLRADGQPRKLTRSILFANGRKRKLIEPLFFKKNGKPRPFLSNELQALFEKNKIARWIETFDTPSISYIEHLEDTREQSPSILVLLPLGSDQSEAVSRAHAVARSIGANFSVLLPCAPKPGNSNVRDDVQRIFDSAHISTIAADDPACQSFDLLVHVGVGALVRPHGIRMLADGLAANSGALASYSDTVFHYAGEPQSSWFKPNFSPLLSQGMTLFDAVFAINLAVFRSMSPARSNRLDQVDWRDLERALRSNQVVHLPHVCYLLSESLRLGPKRRSPSPLFQAHEDTAYPKVAIIIPTRNRWDLLGPCLLSVEQSNWPDDKLSVIVVDNGSDDPETLSELFARSSAGKVIVLRDEDPFNFSRLNNAAVRSTDADLLVFLNNDTEIRDPDWLRKLSYYAIQPGVGAVGAKLLYPDETVQHAGLVVGIRGGAAHGFVGIQRDDPGYNGLALYDREVAAVTGACLAVHRSTFLEAGAFDEALAVEFNDIALCSRLREMGFENVLVADALAIHHESKSRGHSDTLEKKLLRRKEAIYARARYNKQWRFDPYYSPNLSLQAPYQIADVPRRIPVWSVDAGMVPHVLILATADEHDSGSRAIIDRHANALIEAGFRITIGVPMRSEDFSCRGADRIVLENPRVAAAWALDNNIDLIWVHTALFFSCAQWVAGHIPIYAYVYGEPPVRFFPDCLKRFQDTLAGNFHLAMCDRVVAISDSVRQESESLVDAVILPGTDHLPTWTDEMCARRESARRRFGWADSKVVLSACPGESGEHYFGGFQAYVELMREYVLANVLLGGEVRFVLCSRGSLKDTAALVQAGLEVHANVSDKELIDRYAAADIYVSLSRWAGYDLEVAQALAMGLEVIASDIPAHREFGVRTVPNVPSAARAIERVFARRTKREVRVMPWTDAERSVVDQTQRGIRSKGAAARMRMSVPPALAPPT